MLLSHVRGSVPGAAPQCRDLAPNLSQNACLAALRPFTAAVCIPCRPLPPSPLRLQTGSVGTPRLLSGPLVLTQRGFWRPTTQVSLPPDTFTEQEQASDSPGQHPGTAVARTEAGLLKMSTFLCLVGLRAAVQRKLEQVCPFPIPGSLVETSKDH